MKRHIATILILAVLLVGFDIIRTKVSAQGGEALDITFDNGTAGDGSGNGNNGIIVGGVIYTGIIGDAINLDGIDDYIDLGTPDALRIGSGDYSFFTWVKTDNPNYETLGADRNTGRVGEGWFFRVGNTPGDGDLIIRIEEGVLHHKKHYRTRFSNLNDNEWHHVGFTWDNSANSLKIYIDGDEVVGSNLIKAINHNLTGKSISPSNNISLGKRPDGAQYLDGLMDEVKIYNRPLSASEVSNLANVQPSTQISLQVISPNGGETWEVGTNQNIIWTSSSVSGNVSIEYSTDGFAQGSPLVAQFVASSTPNDGSFVWTIPDMIGPTTQIRITDVNDPSVLDTSDENFSIIVTSIPMIEILSPNGGEAWEVGTNRNITWNSSDTSGQVDIEYSTDGFTNSISVIQSTTDDGSFSWTIPNDPNVGVQLRISDSNDQGIFDISNSTFVIDPPGQVSLPGSFYVPSGKQAMWSATDSWGWTTSIGAVAGQTCNLSVWTGRVRQPHLTHPNADTGFYTVQIRKDNYQELVNYGNVLNEPIINQPHATWKRHQKTFIMPGPIGENLIIQLGYVNGAKYFDNLTLECDGVEVAREDFEEVDVLSHPIVLGNPPRVPGSALNDGTGTGWVCVHCALVFPGLGEFDEWDWSSETFPPPPQPSVGISAHWSFDDGTATDVTGSGYDGTVVGAVTAQGTIDGALEFDGVNDYVDIGLRSDLQIGTEDYSFFAWIKTNNPNHETIGADRNTGSSGEGWFFRVGSSLGDGNLMLHLEEGTLGHKKQYKTKNQNLNDNQWHHVGFTWQNSTDSLKMYVDGTELFSGDITKVRDINLSGKSISPNNNLSLGQRPDGAQYFDGLMDEVRSYNRALSQSEISALAGN